MFNPSRVRFTHILAVSVLPSYQCKLLQLVVNGPVDRPKWLAGHDEPPLSQSKAIRVEFNSRLVSVGPAQPSLA